MVNQTVLEWLGSLIQLKFLHKHHTALSAMLIQLFGVNLQLECV